MAVITYRIEPELLRAHLPPGVELDLWQDQALVSLVALGFKELAMAGVPVPGHRRFAQVNLRGYARTTGCAGVVFIRQFVSTRLMTLAGKIWGQPVSYCPIVRRERMEAETIQVQYRLQRHGDHQLELIAQRVAASTPAGSLEQFLVEREWAFRAARTGGVRALRVVHPPWRIHPVVRCEQDVTFRTLCGPRWQALDGSAPIHVMLVEGSAIEIVPNTLCEPCGVPRSWKVRPGLATT